MYIFLKHLTINWINKNVKIIITNGLVVKMITLLCKYLDMRKKGQVYECDTRQQEVERWNKPRDKLI